MTQPHVHVSGVGGVGMNAVAQLLLEDGSRVTGSDRFRDQGVDLPVLRTLEALGVDLVPQDGSALTPETTALVLSTAVEADNPERVRARELGVKERHRAHVLAEAVSRGPLAAVAGTSGKTTCTGWLAWVLAECGLDPNMVNGGGVVDWRTPERPGNVRLADPGNWWAAEVDESDRSLLQFSPEVALINTITADHHSLEESVALFRQFAAKVSGVVVCGPGVAPLLQGTGPELREVSEPVPSPLPGGHNSWNAAAVLAMAIACGCEETAAREALSRFRGVERRLELCSSPGMGPQVYDDYAHNPEKLLAAMQTVQPDDGRLEVVWRPHGFAPLRQNFDAYVDAFAQGLRSCDHLTLLPVFYAGGTAPRGLDSQDVAESLAGRGVQVRVVPEYPDTIALSPADVLLVAGARDPGLPVFAHRMARQFKTEQ